MYYPYFRGRQNELIVIRENAKLLARAGFVPIIEPVKVPTNGLVRALKEMDFHEGRAVLIANPKFGHFKDKESDLEKCLALELESLSAISIGVRIEPTCDLADVSALCRRWKNRELTIVHCGYADGRGLAERLSACGNIARHVFLDGTCSKLYRKHFKAGNRVLIRDGFKKQRTNRDYPPVESFSDLHVTYEDEGMTGFGDFLTVGDDFQESGGAAYAVAIHLTYIDPTKDDEMYVRHFVSERTDGPEDPAGKFGEAVNKLVRELEHSPPLIKATNAVKELLSLHERGHFPGLGYVKKLSMQHHVETLASHFDDIRNRGD